MHLYKKLNNIIGWAVFLAALVVYALTMESSVSFWDCGEFISAAYKLEVVHPPGAPLFILVGRIFSLFAMGDTSSVAMMVNLLSATSTAFVVLFFFWTVTALMRKVVFKDGEYTKSRMVAVFGAGVVAAMGCTFLDSLWFSAIEGEVYALSMFFMAFVVWAAVRWEASDSPNADRWLVLIAFMMGLSLGVHLLSLLAIPVIGAVYYYKNFKPNFKGFVLSQIVSFVVVGVILVGVTNLLPRVIALFDLMFVNSFGLPFYSGVWFVVAMIVVAMIGALYFSHRQSRAWINTAILSFGMILIAFSSYFTVPIRSEANPPINMNKPKDPFRFHSYLAREQYGERPKVKGPNYTADSYDIAEVEKGRIMYYVGEDEYVAGEPKLSYRFKSGTEAFFPRLGFWMDPKYKPAYRSILKPDYYVVDRADNNRKIKKFGNKQLKQAEAFVKEKNNGGQPRYAIKDDISMADNFYFFFKYQIGHMYLRYFAWNFVGKQNDIQGLYNNNQGSWITGIDFIDSMRLKGASQLPKEYLENKSRNAFYALPLILALLGAIYHYDKSPRGFMVVFMLFLINGVIQIMYHNQPPFEPRERDYVLAPSFFAFAMWFAFGVLCIWDVLKNRLPNKMAAASIPVALCAIVPFIMGAQGWDDHNRNGNFLALDAAKGYLESCAPNAVLFTQGDNDTYPLWYAQEVEGIRTDVRIVNLSLAGVDWYIDQLHYTINDAQALNLSLSRDQVVGSKRQQVPYVETPQFKGKRLELASVMKFVASDDKAAKVAVRQGSEMSNYMPSKQFKITVDSAAVDQLNMVAPKDRDKVVDVMEFGVSKRNFTKGDLVLMDIVANNLFDRPIYFSVTVAQSAMLGLQKYVQLEGLANRIVPIVNPSNRALSSRVRTDVAYERMMDPEKFAFSNAKEKDLMMYEWTRRVVSNLRSNYFRIAEALVAEGKTDSAAALIDRVTTELPHDKAPNDLVVASYPEIYYKANQPEKAEAIIAQMSEQAYEMLDYKLQYKRGMITVRNDKVQRALYTIQELSRAARAGGNAELAEELTKKLEYYDQSLRSKFL